MSSSDLQAELHRILNDKLLTPFFQPIVSLRLESIIGYEALIRGPADSPLYSPGVLFNVAERLNLSTDLELLCRELTIASFAERKLKEKLFININPAVLLQPDFKKGQTIKLLQQYQLDPSQVVIELTEHYPSDDYHFMQFAMQHYRTMGFQIAIDDLGCGYSGLRLWSELLPDFVKIDKHFIHGIDKDPVKHNFVKSIQTIASSLNCTMIAEGVETEGEFKAVAKLGISHAQGYYFAKPAATPLAEIAPNLFIKENHNPQLSIGVKNASDIAKYIPPVPSSTTVQAVFDVFQQNMALNFLPLVDDGIPNGLVFRERFITMLFSNRYGLDLFGKKAVQAFFPSQPLLVAHDEAIQSVSQKLVAITSNNPAFIVTRDDLYVGVATLLDLLAEITEQQIQYAKYANPLTLLPGSVPINNFMNKLLDAGQAFCVGYFDLDNFKPFNDVYGYSAGDDIIKLLANTITQNVPADKAMIGHIGGDDFIVVFTCPDWSGYCESILKVFAENVLLFYRTEDLQAGGIVAENRNGESCFFPIISVSVGLVDESLTNLCKSHVEIADLAADAKKQAKKSTGNSLFVNKRKPDSRCY